MVQDLGAPQSTFSQTNVLIKYPELWPLFIWYISTMVTVLSIVQHSQYNDIKYVIQGEKMKLENILE